MTTYLCTAQRYVVDAPGRFSSLSAFDFASAVAFSVMPADWSDAVLSPNDKAMWRPVTK